MKRLLALGAIVLCWHIAGVSSAQAGDSSSLSVEMPKGKSVTEFVTPDGRIDLQATRAAGFEGSLDLDGFNVRLNDQTLLFGDGSDGDATFIPGTYDFWREYNFQNLTVNSGAIIVTHGNIIRVAGTLLNNGTILDYGASNGSPSPGGNGGHLEGITPIMAGSGGAGSGRAGCGGGGGGFVATWDLIYCAEGGNGGWGGSAGENGGTVTIYAKVLDNRNVIHANAYDGGAGQNGTPGTYVHYGIWPIYGDMAGGGGGGGQGGGGGDGGTVAIYSGSFLSYGTVTATRGNGGSGGIGGSGQDCHHSDLGSNVWSPGYGYHGYSGSGGRGEQSTGASQPGGNGTAGAAGSAGTVTFTQTALCYLDADDDGYGDVLDPGTDIIDTNSIGAGFSINNYDCNDNDATVHPGAQEIEDDGIDQDCDGVDASCCVARTGNVDCDPGDGADISDLSALIDNLYISFTPLCCPKEANTDGQPGTDISDLSALIDFLYISFTPTAACQ